MRSRYRCSMCPAIHINSRSWLRSSSTHEPSDPPLRVVIFVITFESNRRTAWSAQRVRTGIVETTEFYQQQTVVRVKVSTYARATAEAVH